jgi:hypothetical protein
VAARAALRPAAGLQGLAGPQVRTLVTSLFLLLTASLPSLFLLLGSTPPACNAFQGVYTRSDTYVLLAAVSITPHPPAARGTASSRRSTRSSRCRRSTSWRCCTARS